MVNQSNQAFTFVNDSPMNSTDPLGLKGWYCRDGQSHYYKGNKMDGESGKCKQIAQKNPVPSGVTADLPTPAANPAASTASARNQAINAYISAASGYNACLNQAGYISKVGVDVGAPAAVALSGLHSVWEYFKSGGRIATEGAVEDPEAGIPLVLVIGPALIIGSGVATIVRAALCWSIQNVSGRNKHQCGVIIW